ncbi:MAG: SurA N-terminal domain-containing protein, partial [Bacteroidales bacterium]|nr:SurA N-terminal domain-containing protein [Bacteroidales bacterium]
MAVLENIRVKLGVFITILIALSLLSFIIDPSTLSTTFQRMSADNKVGSMNGKTITYQEYYTAVEQNKNLMEMLYGQSLSSEEQLSQVRDYTWQNYFDRYVFEPKAADAGLAVGDQEMYDLTQGTNISPVLTSQTTFLDENGNFSREALSQFIQNIDYDATGSYAAYWDYLRDQIYKQQLYGKYDALLYNSSIFNKLQNDLAIEANNLTSDVDFVMVTVGFADDSLLNITDNEIKQYYNKHKEQLRQNANRDIEYVMFEVEPSQADIEAKRAEFEEVYNGFKTADNLKNYVALHSDAKWDNTWYSKAALEGEPEFQAVAFGGRAQVSEIREDGTSFSAARVAERGMVSDSAHVYYAAFALTDEASADELVKKAKASHTMPEGFNEMGWLTQQITAANGLTDFDVVFAQKAGRVV